eukprot:TRINITY_DN1217_c0_g1_i1.p1 TRINITY_DN1217_c0_g1~~TRINITY_DN1217_c0_g1_i1.p1  ORF type:complete len:170 (-),score=44.19 TRINITY_DN1217_c0_g1_i1:68-577(-)
MVMRLNISDAKTGTCIYEKVWMWNGTSVGEGICKLVQTFHQISKELGDTGEVAGVLFEIPEVGSRISMNGQGSVGKRSKSNLSTMIKLTCEKNKIIIVSLFHSATDDKLQLQKYAEDLLMEFTSRYGKEVSSLIPFLDKDPPEIKTEELFAKFAGFDEHVEKSRQQHIL